MTELELRASGKRLTGWTDVSVKRSIEQLASSFSLGASELWTVNGEAIPLLEGSSCTVLAGSRQLLGGYIDTSTISYGYDSHGIRVAGRSTLADLVDCSCVLTGGQFRNQTLEDIVSAICGVFGIEMVSRLSMTHVFRRFALQDTETALETIERAAKVVGALVMSDDDGRLLLTGIGNEKASTILRYGENIKAGKRIGSFADRYSAYTVKSQNSGSSGWNGRKAARIKAIVTDEKVDRYRPIVFISENQVDEAGARIRGEWERNTRSGKSERIAYTVQGWSSGGGKIWTPNTRVSVEDELLGVNAELLIASVELTKTEDGELAELELARPEAYNVLATPPAQAKKDNAW